MKGRFKSLFGRKSPNSASASDDKNAKEFIFSSDILEDLSKEYPVLYRSRALKELGEVVSTKEIEEHAIEAIWKKIEDLFHPSVITEGRQAALQFMISLVMGQYKQLGLLRGQFFRLIENHNVNEDLYFRVTLLKWLTDNGKDISYYEQIGAFLVQFMSEALLSKNADDFLQLLVNIVRFNSSFLDKEIICSLVRNTCDFCHIANTESEVEGCLSLLDATVKYGGLPSEGLFPLIVILCRTVNIKKFSQPSWKLMRSLIGTTLGHTALNLMCCILEDNNNVTDLTLLRGAVFFVGMCIWGSKRVTSLRYLPLHVLPAFKISLQCASFVVAHEVGLSLLRLVKKFGAEQDLITWDIILDIVEILLKLLENLSAAEFESLFTIVQSILTAIENLYSENKLRGSVSRFFSIIEACSKDRPESSIIILLSYYQEQITPSRDDWLDIFHKVLENYLKNDKRTSVRIRVVNMIAFVFSHYKYKYEDELLELFLKNYLLPIEKDEEVRLVISQLLANLLQLCSSVQYSDLLQVIDGFLSTFSNRRDNMQDIEIIIDALIRAYKDKLFSPQSMFVVNIFTLLVNHVTLHYLNNLPPLIGGSIRCKVFASILNMRANHNHFIGVADGDNARYSAHAIFKSVNEETAGCGEIWSICCDYQIAFDAILKCLKNELDWTVLELVLKNLPHQLKNKSLFIYCQCNINKLCAALSNLVNDKMYLNKVQNCPATFGISELRNLIFPILAVIATYHNYLSKERQFELLKCLEFGLNTFCAKTCVSCLTICTLEMQSVMTRTLPSILVKLSQISATVTMAVPVLQFLSTLKEISCLYANFVEEQYMSIFAMALPYTDSFKYSVYIVTLAHQVIADWFTRCRLAFRKGFVTLIAKALKSNSITNSEKKDESYIKKCALHEHMTEVCLDMMARYSFSHHLCQPQRSPVINYLLDKGDSQTWLLSNMLITITTSCGSQQKCQYCTSSKPNLKKLEMTRKIIKTNASMNSEIFSNMQSPFTGSTFTNVFSSFNQIPSEPIPVVAASSCLDVFGEKESSCEEEGAEVEVTPLVVKVAQELVEYQDIFSPSEQLLFSRQVSKVCVSEISEKDDYDNDDGGENDDDYDDDEENQNNDNDEQIENNDNGYCNPNPNPNGYCNQIKQFATESEGKENGSDHVLQFVSDEFKYIKNNLNNFQVKDKETIVSPSFGKIQDTNLKVDHEKILHSNNASTKNNILGECKCISEGWAEIYIRRPTGNVSWIMRIENHINLPASTLSDLSLLASSLDGHTLNEKLGYQPSTRRRSSHSRRYSTGSIEMVKLKGSSVTDDVAWSLNQEDNLQELTERFSKAPLSKSLSSPKKVEQAASATAEDTQSFHSRLRAFSAIEPVMHDDADGALIEERGVNNGISPYFIFLQLFYSPISCFSDKMPLLLDHSEVIERAVHILDRIPTFNTHKFGVLFVDRGQEKSEVEILSNEFGSTRYTDFISGLGELVQLSECLGNGVFTGGMDCSGADGKFAYTWKDDTTQVIFHVATLMPNRERDSQCYSKKLHIGNNFVTIIYDESKFGYAFGTIKGQMSLAEVLIRPLENNSNVVTIRVKDNCDGGAMHNRPYIISDQNLPVLVRQLAIHTNIAIVTELSEKTTTNAFASNWLERLLQINRIKSKATSQKPLSSYEDTTDFVNYT